MTGKEKLVDYLYNYGGYVYHATDRVDVVTSLPLSLYNIHISMNDAYLHTDNKNGLIYLDRVYISAGNRAKTFIELGQAIRLDNRLFKFDTGQVVASQTINRELIYKYNFVVYEIYRNNKK